MSLFNRFFLAVATIFFLGCKNNSYNSIETSNIPKNKKTNVTDQINELKEEIKKYRATIYDVPSNFKKALKYVQLKTNI